LWLPLPMLDAAEELGQRFTTKVGYERQTSAETVACLRSLSADHILANQAGSDELLADPVASTAFLPVVDGRIIPQQPLLAISLGLFDRVPVTEGTNRDEGSLFVALAFDLQRGAPLSAAESLDQVRAGAQVIVDGLAAQLRGRGQPAHDRGAHSDDPPGVSAP